jgi:hypothetical protein
MWHFEYLRSKYSLFLGIYKTNSWIVSVLKGPVSEQATLPAGIPTVEANKQAVHFLILGLQNAQSST